MLDIIALAAAASTMKSAPVVFPCKRGEVYVYQGHGKWQSGSGRGSIFPEKVTLHSRVLRCINRPGERITIVRGLPFDDAWYFDGAGRSTYAIIQTRKGLYIQKTAIGPAIDLTKLKPKLHKKYLRFPVKKNECARKSHQRQDGMYCWWVDSVEKKSGKTLWNISYSTMPDDSLVQIEPGVGIVSYQYTHHGTVAEVTMHLVRRLKK